MRANTAPKYQDTPLTDEVQRKLILSFEECTSMPERQDQFSLYFIGKWCILIFGRGICSHYAITSESSICFISNSSSG